jgi:cation transport ATPase
LQSNPVTIHRALYRCGARSGSCRWDHIAETYANEKEHDFERKEMEKLKDSTQTLCIGSALIVTVTFGATFALPGGYRADDHTNGGTPTLAGRYSFDAFMIATALAFICSAVGTIGLMFSGLPMLELKSRRAYFRGSVFFVANSVVSLTAAFALGVHMVLAPVAQKTIVAVSVISPLVAVSIYVEGFLKSALLARPLCSRIGLIPAAMNISRTIIGRLLHYCWPLLLIFSWPVIARNH